MAHEMRIVAVETEWASAIFLSTGSAWRGDSGDQRFDEGVSREGGYAMEGSQVREWYGVRTGRTEGTVRLQEDSFGLAVLFELVFRVVRVQLDLR